MEKTINLHGVEVALPYYAKEKKETHTNYLAVIAPDNVIEISLVGESERTAYLTYFTIPEVSISKDHIISDMEEWLMAKEKVTRIIDGQF